MPDTFSAFKVVISITVKPMRHELSIEPVRQFLESNFVTAARQTLGADGGKYSFKVDVAHVGDGEGDYLHLP